MKNSVLILLSILVVGLMVLTACKPAVTEQPAEEAAAEEPAAVEEETASAEEAAETKVGGTFVIGISNEPDTLDCQKSAQAATNTICQFFGGALVALSPENGEVVPYHAEDWVISEDGLTYTFHLKSGITFHDGSALVASDYAYSLNRLINPETAAPTAGAMEGVVEIYAVDDLTLELKLEAPNAFLLSFLAAPGYTMPYSESYMTENGDDYFANNPMGVGPYIFEEYVTGSKVTLNRNPHFSWGPAFSNQDAFNFDTIEVLIIPEESTILAGVETGEIHYVPDVSANMAMQYGSLENVVLTGVPSFAVSGLFMNVNHPILSDLNVRKAINYAINRDAIVDLIFQGNGVSAYSSLSATIYGYDPETENTGYHFDANMVADLLEESGYVIGDDGIYEKDGERLSLTINTEGLAESKTKLAEVVQQQFKEAGIEITIQQMDEGIAVESWATGQYELQLLTYDWESAGVLPLIFHTMAFGGGIWGGYDNNGLDDMLMGVQTIVDKQAWLDNVHAVQQHIIQDALFAPIYTPYYFSVLSKEVNDATPMYWGGYRFENAYLNTD